MADKLIGSPKAGIRVVAEVHHGANLADIVKLPSYAKLEEFAAAMKEEEARVISINAEIDAHPLDGAHALFQVMMQTFGWVGTQAVASFFGSTPPTFLDIPNGPTTTVSIPWGRLSVPHFEGGYLETLGQPPAEPSPLRHQGAGSQFVQAPRAGHRRRGSHLPGDRREPLQGESHHRVLPRAG